MTDTTLVLAATYLDAPLQAGVVFDSMLEDGMHAGWQGWSNSSRQMVEAYGPQAGGPLWKHAAKNCFVHGCLKKEPGLSITAFLGPNPLTGIKGPWTLFCGHETRCREYAACPPVGGLGYQFTDKCWQAIKNFLGGTSEDWLETKTSMNAEQLVRCAYAGDGPDAVLGLVVLAMLAERHR